MTVLGLTALLAGCGDGAKREYAVPNALCGKVVDAKALATVLPAGKKITSQETRDKFPNVTQCTLRVDGKDVIAARYDWWDKETSPSVVSREFWNVKNGELTKDDRYFISETGGVGRVSGCRTTVLPNRTLYAGMELRGSAHKNSQAMKRLIVSYTEALEQSDDCKHGQA
ncbi:hypothetical protein AB0D42_00820 [Streptomyces sp. NPDC048304]|uniref:hypothetical protein n=1 Tax=Streptomyces sp. NPDC048304 TaxID=3154820 RepID=UPI0033C169FB